MTESVSNNSGSGGIRSKQDIEALIKSNPNAKNLEQLQSVFDRLDTNHDGVLQEEEGSIHYFEDGAISGMKNGKLVSGASKEGRIYDFENGNVKATDNTDNSTTEYVYKSEKNNYDYKNVLYKKYSKDGKEYILSPQNKKLAIVDKDGSLRTGFKIGDSYQETLEKLGLNLKDPETMEAMKQANPGAEKRGRFATESNPDGTYETGTEVRIPKSLFQKYNIEYLSNSIRLVPKPEEE